MNPITRRALAVAAVAVVLVGVLAACSSPSPSKPVVAPITRSAGSLQGKTITLPLDTVLNINTGSLSVTSYSGVISNPSVAKFTKGHKSSTAEFNPGVTPLKVGTTKVVLKNSNGGIQWVTFTVKVVNG